MSDDLPCGWPFEQQAMQDERTLEGMIDSMGLRSILLILQEIAYAKADPGKISLASAGIGTDISWRLVLSAFNSLTPRRVS